MIHITHAKARNNNHKSLVGPIVHTHTHMYIEEKEEEVIFC